MPNWISFEDEFTILSDWRRIYNWLFSTKHFFSTDWREYFDEWRSRYHVLDLLNSNVIELSAIRPLNSIDKSETEIPNDSNKRLLLLLPYTSESVITVRKCWLLIGCCVFGFVEVFEFGKCQIGYVLHHGHLLNLRRKLIWILKKSTALFWTISCPTARLILGFYFSFKRNPQEWQRWHFGSIYFLSDDFQYILNEIRHFLRKIFGIQCCWANQISFVFKNWFIVRKWNNSF